MPIAVRRDDEHFHYWIAFGDPSREPAGTAYVAIESYTVGTATWRDGFSSTGGGPITLFPVPSIAAQLRLKRRLKEKLKGLEIEFTGGGNADTSVNFSCNGSHDGALQLTLRIELKTDIALVRQICKKAGVSEGLQPSVFPLRMRHIVRGPHGALQGGCRIDER